MKYQGVEFEKNLTIQEIDAKLAEIHKFRTSYTCGDDTFVKITDAVGYSEEGKEWINPEDPERRGFCVGFAGYQIRVIWWGNRNKINSLNRYLVKKV